MNLDTARVFFNVFCFVSFILFVVITYRKGAVKQYDDVAQRIIDDDDSSFGSEVNAEKEQKESSLHSTREHGANK